jgi:hypothetical protein
MAGLRLLNRIDGEGADRVDAFFVEERLAGVPGETRFDVGGFG